MRGTRTSFSFPLEVEATLSHVVESGQARPFTDVVPATVRTVGGPEVTAPTVPARPPAWHEEAVKQEIA